MKKVVLLSVAISLGLIVLTIAPRISEGLEPCYYVTDTQGSGYGVAPLPPCGSCYLWDGEDLTFLGPITHCVASENSPGCVAHGCKNRLSHCLESTE